jgi:PAS domain S-box-containing protein
MTRWRVLDQDARPYTYAVALVWVAAICQVGLGLHGEHLRSFVFVPPMLALAVTGLLYAAQSRAQAARGAIAAEQLRLAQDGTGLGVYQLDFARNTAFASPSLCRLLGQPVMTQPIPLDRWFAALHPEHVAGAMRSIEQRVERGQLRYSVEQQIKTTDGSIRWLETQVQLHLDSSGAVAAAHGATIDITERKLLLQTQDELRQTVADMRRLHALGAELAAAREDLSGPMDSLLQVILEFHGAAQGFLTLRREAENGFAIVAQRGLTAGLSTVIGTPTEVAATAREPVLAAHARFALEAGFAAVLCTPMLTADGRLTGVIAVLLPQGRASTARESELSELCAAMAGAVVERERARARADEQGSRFAVALDSSTVPFNILAPVRDCAGRLVDLRWTYLNAAAARLEGREPGELLTRAVTEIRPRNWEAPGLLARFAAVLDEGGVCEFETQSVQRPELWLHVIAAPLLGSVAVWFSDISERKRQERERAEADQRKDEFLATLAHELRNPLAPILQSIRIARGANASEDQVRWAHAVIERQVQHMALLLDDLLDVSRITRGNLLLRKAPVSRRPWKSRVPCSRRKRIDADCRFRTARSGWRPISSAWHRSSPTCSRTPPNTRIPAARSACGSRPTATRS